MLKLIHPKSTLFIFIVGVVIWSLPTPAAVDAKAWTMFSIFLATIYGIITAPIPIGFIALMGIALCALTNTLTIEQALSGYGNGVLWLIMFAFFISRGFSKTNLGRRIAYILISKIGKTTLGLSYGFVVTDLILAPFMPSATARGGGTIYPIANTLVGEIRAGSTIRQDYGFNTGKFLMMVCYQSVVITSCMFLTSMAGNPIAQNIAAQNGIEITWFSWFLGAIVPGLLTLFIVPQVLYLVCPPDVKDMSLMQVTVRNKLKEMGPMDRNEKIMAATFVFLLFSWVVLSNLTIGDIQIKISSTTTALLGCIILLLTNVLKWDDILEEKGAWKTFFWFGALLMMSDYLVELKIIAAFGGYVSELLNGLSSSVALVVAFIVYFFAHYFFASTTARISVFYGLFLTILLNFGFPPMASASALAYFALLSASLTHYGLTPGPIFFSAGFFSIASWWKVGFIMGIVYIAIWSTVGLYWWKLLGWW